MGNGLLISKRTIGARQEYTEGTFAQPAVTDANLQLYDVKFDPDVNVFKRNPYRNNLSKLVPVIGIQRAKLTARAEIRGPDDVGGNLGIPETDLFVHACGWKRVDAMKSTTVNVDSASGQPVLSVVSNVGFTSGDVVLIAAGTSRQEVLTIGALIGGAAISFTANLGSTHTAVQADTVQDLDNITTRVYSPTSTFGVGAQTLSSGTSASGQAILTVVSNAGFSAGAKIRVSPSDASITGAGDYTVAAIPFGSSTQLQLKANLAANVGTGLVVQNLSSTHGYPMSIEMQADGLSYRLRGVRGNAKLACKVGEPAFWDLSLEGALVSVGDTGTAFTPTYGTKVPPAFFSSSLTLGGSFTGSVFTALELDTNNTLTPRDNANSAAGMLSTLITDREPNGSFDPEAELEATYGTWTKFLAGTTAALSATIGTTSKNRVVIGAPAITYSKVGDTDRNRIATYAVSFDCDTLTANGDDEITLTYS